MVAAADIKAFQLGAYGLGAAEGASGEFDVIVRQAGVYALSGHAADHITNYQFGALTLGAAQTANGLFLIKAYQLGVYALVRAGGDRRELRAWSFKQDEHEFYGIQLGAEGTLVFDKLSEKWSQWKSPEEIHWRVEDVATWEGLNLGCDTATGKIWRIDAEGRLDYGTTPIVSTIVGYITGRFREYKSCFMAELALSEGNPPDGFDDGTVGITLRTSDDDGFTFLDHGTIAGGGITEDMTGRWYGLGLIHSPGRIFEITDTGYARRIDALDIEVDDE